MSIEYRIRDLALSDPTVAGLLGARWYPAPLPENPTYMALTYQEISQVNESSHSGNSNLARTRLQLTLWGTSHSALVGLRDNLKRVLRDFRGTVGGIRIDRIIWSNDLSTNEPDTQIQQRIVDLVILHYVQY